MKECKPRGCRCAEDGEECLPNICTCADGSERKTLTQLRPLLDLKEICDGELPESCLCAGGEERLAIDAEHPLPVLLTGIMKECKPAQLPEGGREGEAALRRRGAQHQEAGQGAP